MPISKQRTVLAFAIDVPAKRIEITYQVQFLEDGVQVEDAVQRRASWLPEQVADFDAVVPLAMAQRLKYLAGWP